MPTRKPAAATKASSTKLKASPAPAAMPERHLFGTDGIRGLANEGAMTPESALALGRAVTFLVGQ